MNFFEAGPVKELLEKTLSWIIMQGGHQSEPVNWARTNFLFFFAEDRALSRLVVQPPAVAKLMQAKMAIVVVMICLIAFIV